MAAISDLELLEIQVDALFTHHPDGRIRAVNERGAGSLPRFFFGRTRAGNLWRFRYNLPEHTVRKLERLAAYEPVYGDLRVEPRILMATNARVSAVPDIHILLASPTNAVV